MIRGMTERTAAAEAVDQRVDDLLQRMTLAEKAGMLFQTMIVIGSGDLSEPSSTFGIESAEYMINTQALSHFNLVRTVEDARALAEWHNRLQSLALSIAGLSSKFDFVAKLWPPLSYFMMPLSGVAFIVDALPPRLQQIALYLPMLNALEYLREGWFGSLMRAHYDLGYVAAVNAVLTFVGLSIVRQSQLDTSDE